VHPRPRVRFAKDYEAADVARLYQRRSWSSWQEIVEWLRTAGPTDPSFTPGEVARMLADFTVLAQENIPFVADPGTAFALAQAHRTAPAVLRALAWVSARHRAAAPGPR